MYKPYVLGIDIGGTNTVFGVVDQRGQIISTGSIKTKHETALDYMASLVPELNHIISEVGGKDKFKGIGVGAPNANHYSGCIEKPANLNWAKEEIVPLKKMISEATHVPCAITNDANAAAVGEMTYGVAKGMKNFIMITLGTGVGSGIVVNGEIVYGHDGLAGELGHVIIRRDNGRLCGCGRRGCLETYASATGVAQTAREIIMARKKDTLLNKVDINQVTSKDVYEAAQKGDEVAIEIFNTTGEILGEAFADFIAFSSPEAIILFGGLTRAGDFIMNPIQKALDQSVLSNFKGKTELLLSAMKDSDAAILGASALAWKLKC